MHSRSFLPVLKSVPPIRLLTAGAALLLVVAAIGVGGRAMGPGDGCPSLASGGLGLTVDRRRDNVLMAEAMVRPAGAASVYVEYGNDQLGWLRTPTTDVGASHRVPLLRLRSGTSYEARAFALDEGGCPIAGARAEFTTGELPSAFKKLSVETSGQLSAPLTVVDFNLSENEMGTFSYLRGLMALDREGQPVWYYQLPAQTVRASTATAQKLRVHGFIRLQNGHFLYVARGQGLEEIGPDGRLVRRVQMSEARVHHDLLQLPDGRVLVLGSEERAFDDTRNGGAAEQRVLGDRLYALDLESGQEREVWNGFEALDPAERVRPGLAESDDDDGDARGALDWTHANSLSLGPRENLLISLRQLDQVISLSPDLRSIEWKLGGPGSSFTFRDSEDRFYAQHAATALDEGRVLLFDNGTYRPEGQYSRALELQLDFATMTAHKVWEYRPQRDYFSRVLSNAVRLGNGNTLVNFGFPTEPDGAVLIAEARPDESTAGALSMRIRGKRHSSYRAYPLDSLAGETEEPQPTPLAS